MPEPTSADAPPSGLRARLAPLAAAVDPFILALLGTVALASLLPVRGQAAPVAAVVTDVAIGLLFFLYGARLETRTALRAMTDWRLHLAVLAMTFVLYPLAAWGLATGLHAALGTSLAMGVIYLGILPSTVNSSVAFTSIAGGNVAAAICAASLSSLLGVVVTPLLAAGLLGSSVHLSTTTVGTIALQIFAPFVLGQLLRPLIGSLVTAHPKVTKATDRGAILLVVYTAFSAGVVEGIWHRVGVGSLLLVAGCCLVLLALGLSLTLLAGRWLGFSFANRAVLLFAGSKKSLATGVPMATVLLPASVVGVAILPIMVFHQVQLIVCAVIARSWAGRPQPADPSPAGAQSTSVSSA